MSPMPWSARNLGLVLRRITISALQSDGALSSEARQAGYALGAAELRGAAAAAAADPASTKLPHYVRPHQVTPFRRRLSRLLQIAMPISGVGLFWYAYTHPDEEGWEVKKYSPELQYLAAQQSPNTDTLTNWSGTHEVTPKRYFQPDSEADVEAFLRIASRRGDRLRPAGSGLSPNGAALSGEGVMALGGLDRVVAVDKEKMQVIVQAGCRVQQVADALAAHGLTLQNFASIREQQIGGITQVGAHGTGPRLPPVDEQVVAMRLSTPALGTISLSGEQEPELFRLARVGLGSLGVMTQATLRVVPREQLVERTFTATPAEVRRNHVKWLQENKHIKYLYLPYTSTVVVVTANPAGSPEQLRAAQEAATAPPHSQEARTEALRRLYASANPSSSPPDSALSGPQLRDALLASGPGPLAPQWVAAVNAAEAEYWRRSAGVRVGPADEILGFECGGQQWVLEVAFPVAPSLDGIKPGARTKDLEFLDTLMAEISKSRMPAPAPIEVRWTSGSSSPLSPAAGPPESLHCWVGVIMYLPQDPAARQQVTRAFREYARLVETKLMPRFNATWHWAKLEAADRAPSELEGLVRPRLTARFGPALAALGRYRAVLDSTGTLSNPWLDAVLGPVPKLQGAAAEAGAGK